MEGKLSKKQKLIEVIAIIIILISSFTGVRQSSSNKHEIIALSFIGVIMYGIFLTITFFPATWNMTKKQREKIDIKKYQNKYKDAMVIFNLIYSILFSYVILNHMK